MTVNEDLERLMDELASDYTEAFEEAVRLHCTDWPNDDGTLTVLEGIRQTFRLANAGHLLHLEADPAYPLLIKMQSLQRQMMLPSADAVYHHARISGDYTYRLRGPRGSAHIFQIAVYAGSSSRYPDFKIFFERTNFDHDALSPGKELDLVLSAEKREGTWFQIPKGEGELHIRQYYYDWNTEQPARLWIEREDAVYPPPPMDLEDTKDRVGRVASWLRVHSNLYRQYVQSFLDSDPAEMPAISIPGAFEGTKYLNGHYRCQPDEAVIFEVEKPQVLFWSFQLSNLQWEALDYYMRSTSINGHQAVIDDDGVFRAVISHKDPGTPNWFDAGGRTLGLISGRYFKADTAPGPKLKTVALDRVRDHLPERTGVITPEQRQAQLRQKLISAHARLCSDQ